MATFKKRFQGVANHMCMNPKCMSVKVGEGWYYETFYRKSNGGRHSYILMKKFCSHACSRAANWLWKYPHTMDYWKYLNPPPRYLTKEQKVYEKLKSLIAENYQLDLGNERTSAFWYDRDIRVDIGIGIEVPAEDYFSPLWKNKGRKSALSIKREPRKRVVKNNTVRTDNN